jgi:hypothetical protein
MELPTLGLIVSAPAPNEPLIVHYVDPDGESTVYPAQILCQCTENTFYSPLITTSQIPHLMRECCFDLDGERVCLGDIMCYLY